MTTSIFEIESFSKSEYSGIRFITLPENHSQKYAAFNLGRRIQ